MPHKSSSEWVLSLLPDEDRADVASELLASLDASTPGRRANTETPYRTSRDPDTASTAYWLTARAVHAAVSKRRAISSTYDDAVAGAS